MDSEVKMVLNHTYHVEVININLTPEELGEWRHWAAHKIAEQILANGCLMHQSKYDINKQYTHESFSVLVAQRERKLP